MDKYIRRIQALLRIDDTELARSIRRMRALINGEEAPMASDNMKHMEWLERVVASDVAVLRTKEETYQGSWKRRGGRGVFHMFARIWDHLEAMLVPFDDDVFMGIADHPLGDNGTPLVAVRDLRRYLLLCEAEMCARGDCYPEGEPTEGPRPTVRVMGGGSIRCPDCGDEVWVATLATEGTCCPHCGTDLAAPPPEPDTPGERAAAKHIVDGATGGRKAEEEV